MQDSRISKLFNYPYTYLIIGFTLLFFFNGRWNLPVVAFLAPVFLIRFLRLEKPFIGFLWIILAGWISNIFIWKGMMPMSGFFYYFLMLMMSIFTSLTFLTDRIYSQKIKGISSSLIFPSAYVVMDYIVISTNPSGSYGTLVHTQSSLPLLQLISITGIWGVTFLITWTASVINWLWDNSFERNKINKAVLIYVVPVIAILIFGQIRLSKEIKYDTVRIASIKVPRIDLRNQNPVNQNSINEIINRHFLISCDIAATSKAKMVFGTEAIITLSHDKENEFVEQAKSIAIKDSIYIGLPMIILPEGFPNVLPENKITWISPGGELLITYYKAKPTPGEGKYGDGILKYFDSPYGRISTAICFDMDFPSLIHQIRKMHVDIMLVPGSDWKEITPYHTYVASIRAIEQGFNLVRSVNKGLSASFNYKGQLISSLDFFKTKENILYADVPVKGQRTIYSGIGDLFAWICILFLACMSIVYFTKK